MSIREFNLFTSIFNPDRDKIHGQYKYNKIRKKRKIAKASKKKNRK